MDQSKKCRTRQVNTRLTDDEFEALRRKCFDENIKRSAFIQRLIQTALSFGIFDGKNNT